MGEVRIKVKITNAIDEAMARRGQISEDEIRSYEADALVDTGAVSSVVPKNVMTQLGVLSIGNRVAEYADGRTDIVELTEPLTFNIIGRIAVEPAMVLGDEVINDSRSSGFAGRLPQSKADSESRPSRPTRREN